MSIIEKGTPEDLDELLIMATDLWPDYTAGELQETLSGILATSKFNILLYRETGKAAGFIYLAIRTDYVEGSDSTPTGYVEGIYVKPAHRRKGIAQELLAAGTTWLKNAGCTQLGSDIYLDNKVSYAFHTRMGFKEAGRLIAFIKDL